MSDLNKILLSCAVVAALGILASPQVDWFGRPYEEMRPHTPLGSAREEHKKLDGAVKQEPELYKEALDQEPSDPRSRFSKLSPSPTEQVARVTPRTPTLEEPERLPPPPEPAVTAQPKPSILEPRKRPVLSSGLTIRSLPTKLYRFKRVVFRGLRHHLRRLV
jgi:hypothetical protein